jgi:hypothetical protein
MKKNMGNTDRIIRVLLAVIITALIFTNVISSTLALVLGILAGIFILTSLVSFCPLYPIFGVITCARSERNSR